MSSKKAKSIDRITYVVIGIITYFTAWLASWAPFDEVSDGCNLTLVPNCQEISDKYYYGFLAILLLSLLLLVVFLLRRSNKFNNHLFVGVFVFTGLIWPLSLPYLSADLLAREIDQREEVAIQLGAENLVSHIQGIPYQLYYPDYLPKNYEVRAINITESDRVRIYFSKYNYPSNPVITDQMIELSINEDYDPPDSCPNVLVDKEVYINNPNIINVEIRPFVLDSGCNRTSNQNIFTVSKSGAEVFYTQRGIVLIKLISTNGELPEEKWLKIIESMKAISGDEFIEFARKLELHPPAGLSSISDNNY